MGVNAEKLSSPNGSTLWLGSSVVEIIQTRRSLRGGFTDEPIPSEVITEIVQSGLTAPSSKNAQPWRIHVVPRGEQLTDIAAAVESAKAADNYVPIDPSTGLKRRWSSTVAESAQVLREVAAGLFVENRGCFSGGRQSVAKASDEFRGTAVTGYSFEMIGMGAMMQNMWLSARARGLEGVFMGDVLVAEPEIQSMLGFSGDLVGVLALGYTAQLPHEKILAADTVVYHAPNPGEW